MDDEATENKSHRRQLGRRNAPGGASCPPLYFSDLLQPLLETLVRNGSCYCGWPIIDFGTPDLHPRKHAYHADVLDGLRLEVGGEKIGCS